MSLERLVFALLEMSGEYFGSESLVFVNFESGTIGVPRYNGLLSLLLHLFQHLIELYGEGDYSGFVGFCLSSALARFGLELGSIEILQEDGSDRHGCSDVFVKRVAGVLCQC